MAKNPLAAVVAVDHDGLWIRCIRATLLIMQKDLPVASRPTNLNCWTNILDELICANPDQRIYVRKKKYIMPVNAQKKNWI